MLIVPIVYSCLAVITIKGIVASPLPKENERNIPAQHVFPSSQFKDTDDICEWLYKTWINGLNGRGARQTEGVTLPLVISRNIQIDRGAKQISFNCLDYRTNAMLADALTRLGEVEISDTFFLKCEAGKEFPTRKSKLDNTAGRGKTRSSGICRRIKAPSTAGTSTEVPAGGSACLDAEGQAKMDRVLAYLDSDDYGAEQDPTDEKYVEWMNILQLGTSRHEYVSAENSVSITLDHKEPSTYRACAKLRPGSENARLFITSI